MAVQLLPALECSQLHQEADSHHLRPQLLNDELTSSGHRASGGKQVIDEQDALPGDDGIAVDFDRRLAVLQLIVGPDRLGRELAGLPGRNETGSQLERHRDSKKKPAGLDADDEIDLFRRKGLGHQAHSLG